jgi:Flp pilus assembly protein TadD
VLKVEPRHFDALHFLGVIAYQQGRHAEAVDFISRALAIDARQPAAHSNLGNALEALGELERALQSYREALALYPDFADALVNIASLHARRGERDEAIACYRRGLALQPNQPGAHSNLGNLLRDAGRREEAAAAYRQAIALAPDLPEAHSNLGDVLTDEGRLDEAIASYRRALAARPGYAQAHSNLANTLVQKGLLAEAEASLKEALRLDPRLAHARFNYALLKLLQGDYETGLPLYEARFEEQALSALYSALHKRAAMLGSFPRWKGEPGSRRRLLVWTDQGLGDSLMMLRYLPLLAQKGFGQILVYCEKELVRLVEHLPGVDKVVPASEPMPLGKFDCHTPIMSLPLAFGVRLASIPAQPYLVVPQGLKRDWAARLKRVPQPRIGLLWAGGALYPRNRLRSIRLARLEPVIKARSAGFVSLQKGEEAYQARESGWPIADFMHECRDLLDTAALIDALDLVVGVDSAVTHLTGALGKPMLMMNRFESEWRWLLGRADSPWYPSVRIFRQPAPGDWDSVAREVARALKDCDFGVGRHQVE